VAALVAPFPLRLGRLRECRREQQGKHDPSTHGVHLGGYVARSVTATVRRSCHGARRASAIAGQSAQPCTPRRTARLGGATNVAARMHAGPRRTPLYNPLLRLEPASCAFSAKR
jgi:hypothetical protein